jgi:hypothetical protein
MQYSAQGPIRPELSDEEYPKEEKKPDILVTFTTVDFEKW